jgi:hypothetical protein
MYKRGSERTYFFNGGCEGGTAKKKTKTFRQRDSVTRSAIISLEFGITAANIHTGTLFFGS